jgi:hypothetical protein
MTDPFEQRQETLAGAEAGAIGGRRAEDVDESEQARVEAGGGESEGFEQAEELLQAHATHEDQHAARRVIEDAAGFEDEAGPGPDDESGEGDFERSSELADRDY